MIRWRNRMAAIAFGLSGTALAHAAVIGASPAHHGWVYDISAATRQMAARLFDFDLTVMPTHGGPFSGGVLRMARDLDGDGRDEWLLVPDHECSSASCRFAIVADPAGAAPYLIHEGETAFLPIITDTVRAGWLTVVRFERVAPGQAVAIELVPHKGGYVVSGPAHGAWPMRWAPQMGVAGFRKTLLYPVPGLR